MEKQQMKLVVEETLSKYRGHESSIFESESKRIELQKQYENVNKFRFNERMGW